MLAILNLFRMLSLRLSHEDRGATAVEYGLMVALIAVVIIGAVTLLGENLVAIFNDVADSVGNAT